MEDSVSSIWGNARCAVRAYAPEHQGRVGQRVGAGQHSGWSATRPNSVAQHLHVQMRTGRHRLRVQWFLRLRIKRISNSSKYAGRSLREAEEKETRFGTPISQRQTSEECDWPIDQRVFVKAACARELLLQMAL